MLSYYHTIAFDLDLGFELEREFNLQTFFMSWEEEDEEEEEEEENENESNYQLLLGLICSSRESHTPTLKRKRRKKRNEIKCVEDDGTKQKPFGTSTTFKMDQRYQQSGLRSFEVVSGCQLTFFKSLLEDLVESSTFLRWKTGRSNCIKQGQDGNKTRTS